jgi:hypothetical protein
MLAPGPTVMWSPSSVWWPMRAPRLTTTWRPRRVWAATITPTLRIVPSPSELVDETRADGWTRVAKRRPCAAACSVKRLRWVVPSPPTAQWVSASRPTSSIQ